MVQEGLAKMTKAQAKLDEIRSKEKSTYQKAKAEGPRALYGLRHAIDVLKEYYTQTGPTTDSSKLIAMLQDIEAKTTDWMTQLDVDEDAAIKEYQTMNSEAQADK